jgi:transposase
MGKKKALVAVAHTILKIVYHVLLKRQSYIELGAEYLEQFRKNKERLLETKMIRELEAKGFLVTKPV